MGFFDNHNEHQAGQQWEQVYNGNPHQGSLTHEMIGGAAAFAAMRAYEQHLAANGNPPHHAFAKELLAGIVGAEVEKLMETKGLNAWDREQVKRHAQQQAMQMYDQTYGQMQYGQQPYPQQQFGGPPQYGQPQYGQPQYGQPQYGQPQYGQPQYGQPQYGQPQFGGPPPQWGGQPPYGGGPQGFY